MSGLLPLSTYNLAVNPFEPVPAIDEEFPVSIRITLAAVDPDSVDEAKQPSTLRILKKSIFADEDDLEDSEDDELDSESEEEEEEEEEVKPKKASPKKSPKKDSPKKEAPKEESEDELNAEDDSDLDSDSDLEDDVEEYVVCTLGPGVQYQQTLDLTITPDEEVYFVATGSYAIHLTGNYIEHPYDGSSSEEDYSDDEDVDSDEYDLTPDEDEILSGEEEYGIDDLEDVEDVEGKIEEIIEEEEQKKKSKKGSKREAEEEKVEEPITKKSKKNKELKKVEFSKELEQGPTGSTIVDKKKEEAGKKFPTKTLIGGVTVEDRTVGKGPICKNGQKVGVRYIGKLTNGKVFDKNTSGKPFVFSLGKGEVIKGWDVGVAGMSVGGERRISIPAPMAYGKQKLPGIPANSQLTFDVKLVSIK